MRASCSVRFSVRRDSVIVVVGVKALVDAEVVVAVSWGWGRCWVWRARRVEGKSLSRSEVVGVGVSWFGMLGMLDVVGDGSCGVKASGEDGSSSGGVSSPRTSSSDVYSSSGILSFYRIEY